MQRLLVDTHILIWHLESDPYLDPAWSDVLEDSTYEKYFSIASLWEIAIKTNIGKLKIDYPIDRLVPADFQLLPISPAHLLAYQYLPMHHRDPFDRILIAQAKTDGLIIMTKDVNFSLYKASLFE